jgi:hypothetical protein
MRKYMLLAVPAMLLVAVATACGGGSSKTVNVPGGGKVSVNTGSLPSEFPKDFPIYSGADFQGSVSSSAQGGKGTAATWQTGDSVDKVTAYYTDQLGGKSNWKQVATTNSSGSVSFIVQKKDDSTQGGLVMISTQDNKTQILVTVGTDLGGSSGSTPSSSDSGSSSSDTPESSSGNATEAPSSQPLPAEAKLSNDFPKDRVPFPSGARVTSTSDISSNGQKLYIIELYVKDTPDKVNEFFKTELAKHDWTTSTTSSQNGEFFQAWGSATDSEGVIVSITASDTDGYAKVGLSVTIKGS